MNSSDTAALAAAPLCWEGQIHCTYVMGQTKNVYHTFHSFMLFTSMEESLSKVSDWDNTLNTFWMERGIQKVNLI